MSLEVRDPEGAGGVGAVILDVEPSEAPVVQLLSPDPNGVFYSDRLITFEATVTDAEDESESLELVWNSILQGNLSLPANPMRVEMLLVQSIFRKGSTSFSSR